MNEAFPTWWGKMPDADPKQPVYATFLDLAQACEMMKIDPWKFQTFRGENVIRSVLIGHRCTEYIYHNRSIIEVYPVLISPPFKRGGVSGPSTIFSEEYLLIDQEKSILIGIIPNVGGATYTVVNKWISTLNTSDDFPPIHYFMTAALSHGKQFGYNPFRILRKGDFQKAPMGNVAMLHYLSTVMDQRISTVREPLEYVFGKRRQIPHDLNLLMKSMVTATELKKLYEEQ